MESQIRKRQLELSEEQDKLMKHILELTGDSPVLLWDVVLDYCGRNHPELYNDPDSKFKELVYLYWKYANRYGRGGRVTERDGLNNSNNYNGNGIHERNRSGVHNWNRNGIHDWNRNGVHDWNRNGMPGWNRNGGFFDELNSNVPNGYNFEEGMDVYEETHVNENFYPENNFYPSMPNQNMPMSYGNQHQSYDPSQCQPQNGLEYPMYAENNFVYTGEVRPFVGSDGTVFPASAVLPAHFVPFPSMQAVMNECGMQQPMANNHQFHHDRQIASHFDPRFSSGEGFYEGVPNGGSSGTLHNINSSSNHHIGSGDPGATEHRNHLNTNAPPFTPKVLRQYKPTSPQVDVRPSTISENRKQDVSTSPAAPRHLDAPVPGKQELSSRGPAVVPRKLVPYQGSGSDPLPIRHDNVTKTNGENVNAKTNINGMCNGHSTSMQEMPLKGILKTPPNGIHINSSNNSNRVKNNSNRNRGSGRGRSNNYVKFVDL